MELYQYADQNDIDLDVTELSYNQYKCHVKRKIREQREKKLETAKTKKTKLRHINPGVRQEYLEHCSIGEASAILKIRLHMVRLNANYGGGTCRKCGQEQETTEHVLECASEGGYKFDDEKMDDVSWLRKIKVIYEQFEEEYKDY